MNLLNAIAVGSHLATLVNAKKITTKQALAVGSGIFVIPAVCSMGKKGAEKWYHIRSADAKRHLVTVMVGKGFLRKNGEQWETIEAESNAVGQVDGEKVRIETLRVLKPALAEYVEAVEAEYRKHLKPSDNSAIVPLADRIGTMDVDGIKTIISNCYATDNVDTSTVQLAGRALLNKGLQQSDVQAIIDAAKQNATVEFSV